jgi:hypothetical protein
LPTQRRVQIGSGDTHVGYEGSPGLSEATISGPRPAYHLERDRSDVDELIGLVRERYGEAWLDQQAETTVGELWHRRDPSATSQLVILGAALRWAAAEHPAWLERHMKGLKSRDANGRRGAMLELLAMHLLHRSGAGIRPTPQSFPGYDAVVSFADGAELAISLKNYGRSAHERRFLTEARAVENAFTAALRSTGRNGLMLAVWASVHPSDADWRALRAGLPEILGAWTGTPGPWVRHPWIVSVTGTPAAMLPISDRHLSHQVLIASPFHANEAKNLLDKLDGAAANARKHSRPAAAQARAVLVRVPETMPTGACVRWSEGYLARHPDGPVDLVAIYQAANVTDGESTRLHHTIILRPGASFTDWLAAGRVLQAVFEVGTAGTVPSRQHVEGFPEGALNEAYVHQAGTWHRLAQAHPDGAIRGDLASPAPGVNVRAVVRMPDGEFVVEGLFPPDGSVSLFD